MILATIFYPSNVGLFFPSYIVYDTPENVEKELQNFDYDRFYNKFPSRFTPVLVKKMLETHAYTVVFFKDRVKIEAIRQDNGSYIPAQN